MVMYFKFFAPSEAFWWFQTSESLAKSLVIFVKFLSRVLCAPDTSPYHLVPKHLWATGLSNPTSILRPALPLAPKTDDTARNKAPSARTQRHSFLSDFMLYITTNDAISWKRCINYTACLTLFCLSHIGRNQIREEMLESGNFFSRSWIPAPYLLLGNLLFCVCHNPCSRFTHVCTSVAWRVG